MPLRRLLEHPKAQATQQLFKRTLIEPADHPAIQFVRYGLVAALSFVIDFGLLYVFTNNLNIFYLLSTTLAFAISAVVNYILSVGWAFGGRVNRQRSTEVILFFTICAVALGLNDLFMWIFTSVIGLYYLLSKLITVVIVFFWSFGARRLMFHSEKFKKLLRI